MKKYLLAIIVLAVVAIVGFELYRFISSVNFNRPIIPLSDSQNRKETLPDGIRPAKDPILVSPITDYRDRTTKKPFGIKVSPGHSPVSPERFSGYHTGVDFETFPDEQDKQVDVFSVCNGPLRLKKWASGYGGVAVQQCKLDNQDITVVYGHLLLSSVDAKVGHQLKAGDRLAVLGKGYSAETDGERKHLHLAIHKGTSINIRGYVQKQSDLSAWLDALKYLK